MRITFKNDSIRPHRHTYQVQSLHPDQPLSAPIPRQPLQPDNKFIRKCLILRPMDIV